MPALLLLPTTAVSPKFMPIKKALLLISLTSFNGSMNLLMRLWWTTLVLIGMLSFSNVTVRADELADVQRLYYAGQPGVAMQRLNDFLAVHPRDAQMRFFKGVMLTDAKHNLEAIALYQKLTEDFPDLAEPYNNLAALYAANGDYSRARATLEQALRTNPGYATAHENLGDVYAALAAQSYERALKLDPSNVTAAPKLALVRQLVKHPEATAKWNVPSSSATLTAPSSSPSSP